MVTTTRWYTPPTRMTTSGYLVSGLTQAPYRYARSVSADWDRAVEGLTENWNVSLSSTELWYIDDYLGSVNRKWYVDQQLFSIPVQAAWDSTFQYGFDVWMVHGSMPESGYPLDPTDTTPQDQYGNPLLPGYKYKEFERTGDNAGTLVPNGKVQAVVAFKTNEIYAHYAYPEDGHPEQATNRPASAFQLLPGNPYWPVLQGDRGQYKVFKFAPRSFLRTTPLLYKGPATQGNRLQWTRDELHYCDVISPGPFGTIDILIGPGEMIDSSPPSLSGENLFYCGGNVEVAIEYQPPRYRYVLDDAVVTTTSRKPRGTAQASLLGSGSNYERYN